MIGLLYKGSKANDRVLQVFYKTCMRYLNCKKNLALHKSS